MSSRYSYGSPVTYYGLDNYGATSYLNSVLQVLFMTKDFRKALESCRTPGAIDGHLRTLFDDMRKRRGDTSKITKKLGINRASVQGDPAECFEKILRLTSPDASQIFRGVLTHKNKCLKCAIETDSDNPCWSLPLELVASDNKDYNVVNCIVKYFSGSVVTGPNQMYCDWCKAKSDAAINFEMKHHPEVLTLMLKRFKFDHCYNSFVKLNHSVDIPNMLQISKDEMYELYAFVEHFDGGLYTTTIKCQDDGKWYDFNDSYASLRVWQPFQYEGNMKSWSAYLLFYRKKKLSAANTEDSEMSTPAASTLDPSDISEQRGHAVTTKGRKEGGEAALNVDRGGSDDKRVKDGRGGNDGKTRTDKQGDVGKMVTQMRVQDQSRIGAEEATLNVHRQDSDGKRWSDGGGDGDGRSRADKQRDVGKMTTDVRVPDQGRIGADGRKQEKLHTISDLHFGQSESSSGAGDGKHSKYNTQGGTGGPVERDGRRGETYTTRGHYPGGARAQDPGRTGAEEARFNVDRVESDEKRVRDMGGDRGGRTGVDKQQGEGTMKHHGTVDHRTGFGAYADSKYHGLVNQGATCYLNSVLQVLFMTKEFRKALGRSRNPECVDNHLMALFDNLERETTFTYKITQKLDISKGYVQRDAAECFEKILSLTSPEASQIFQGVLTHKNKCLNCATVTDSDNPCWSLPLELVESENKDYRVVNGIAKHFRESLFIGQNQMYCDQCEAKADAVTKFEVVRYPEVFTLLLKRFKFDFRRMEYAKITCSVEVPYTVQLETEAYELYAFVEHFGHLKGGHYTATIKSQDDGKWYNFNDSFVSLPFYQPFHKEDSMRSRSAYLLFYRKKKPRTANTEDSEMSTPAASTLDPSDISEQRGHAVTTKGRKEGGEAALNVDRGGSDDKRVRDGRGEKDGKTRTDKQGDVGKMVTQMRVQDQSRNRAEEATFNVHRQDSGEKRWSDGGGDRDGRSRADKQRDVGKMTTDVRVPDQGRIGADGRKQEKLHTGSDHYNQCESNPAAGDRKHSNYESRGGENRDAWPSSQRGRDAHRGETYTTQGHYPGRADTDVRHNTHTYGDQRRQQNYSLHLGGVESERNVETLRIMLHNQHTRGGGHNQHDQERAMGVGVRDNYSVEGQRGRTREGKRDYQSTQM